MKDDKTERSRTVTTEKIKERMFTKIAKVILSSEHSLDCSKSKTNKEDHLITT